MLCHSITTPGSFLALLLAACCFLLLSLVNESLQDEVTSTTNQHINISNQQETIKSGNTKTNNYNLQESNYQPTQNTHVIFNVGKLKKKLRSSRPPTVDEFKIKTRILDVYYNAREELEGRRGDSLVYFNHLGRILKALNPKYIATKRVALVAQADPRDPDAEQAAPESELPPPPPPQDEINQQQDDYYQPSKRQPLELSSESASGTSIQGQLDALSERVKEIAVWDRNFIQQLFQVPDSEFSPGQLAYKRLFQCMAYPIFCKQQMMLGMKKSNKPILDEQTATLLVEEPIAEASEPTVMAAPVPVQPAKDNAYRQQQQPAQRRYQPQQQYQPSQRYSSRGAATAPQQLTRHFKDSRSPNPEVAAHDLPQRLVQQYAPEYQEQMRRVNKARNLRSFL